MQDLVQAIVRAVQMICPKGIHVSGAIGADGTGAIELRKAEPESATTQRGLASGDTDVYAESLRKLKAANDRQAAIITKMQEAEKESAEGYAMELLVRQNRIADLTESLELLAQSVIGMKPPENCDFNWLCKVASANRKAHEAAKAERTPSTPIPPEVQEAFAMIAVECHNAMAIKKFNAAHDDGHTDKSLAITAAFLLEDYCEPGRQEEWAINRHTLLKKAGRAPWPAAYAHRKFNDSLELQRLVIAAQFTVSEIARVLRAQRVVARNATGEKKNPNPKFTPCDGPAMEGADEPKGR